jgi:O-antigen/teichoic acid export membrane protein
MIALVRSLTSTYSLTVGKLPARHQTVLRGVVTLVDQGVASGCNFATTVIIGRTCLPEELGRYALGFSIMVALLGLPRALVWTPYVSYYPRLSASHRRSYTGSMMFAQLVISLLAGVLVSLAGCLLTWMNALEGFGPVAIALGPAIALSLGREHIRRICFAKLQMGQALGVDLAASSLQLGGLAFLATVGYLNAATAWTAIALACAPVVLAWAWMTRASWRFDWSRLRPDTARNWSYARWLLGEAGIQAVTDMWYPWAVLLLWGAAAVGTFSAALGIVNLANPLLMAVSNFIAPHAAHVLADRGVAAMRRMLTRFTALLAIPMGALTLLIILGSETLIGSIFGHDFVGAGPVMAALSLAVWVDALSVPFYAGNIALGHGRSLVVAMLIRMVCAVVLGTLLIGWHGALGVGYTLLVSNTAAGIWLWKSLHHDRKPTEVLL